MAFLCQFKEINSSNNSELLHILTSKSCSVQVRELSPGKKGMYYVVVVQRTQTLGPARCKLRSYVYGPGQVTQLLCARFVPLDCKIRTIVSIQCYCKD